MTAGEKDNREKPKDAAALVIWERLDSLHPMDFLEITGFGHGYCINIDEATELLLKLGWSNENTVSDGISLLQSHLGCTDV